MVSWNFWREQKEKALSDPSILGNRKWIHGSGKWLFLYPSGALCISLSSTSRNFPKQVSAAMVQIRAEVCDEPRLECLKLRHRHEGTESREITGKSARRKGKVPATDALAWPMRPLFQWTQHPSERGQPYSKPRSRVLGHRVMRSEGRGQSVFCLPKEKIHRHQELRPQMIAKRMLACQVFLQAGYPQRNRDR